MSIDEYQMVKTYTEEAEFEGTQRNEQKRRYSQSDVSQAATAAPTHFNTNSSPPLNDEQSQIPRNQQPEKKEQRLAAGDLVLTSKHLSVLLLFGMNILLVNTFVIARMNTLLSFILIGIANLLAFLYLYQSAQIVKFIEYVIAKSNEAWNQLKKRLPFITLKRGLIGAGIIIGVVFLVILFSQLNSLRRDLRQWNSYYQRLDNLEDKIQGQQYEISRLKQQIYLTAPDNIRDEFSRKFNQLNANVDNLSSQVRGFTKNLGNIENKITQLQQSQHNNNNHHHNQNHHSRHHHAQDGAFPSSQQEKMQQTNQNINSTTKDHLFGLRGEASQGIQASMTEQERIIHGL